MSSDRDAQLDWLIKLIAVKDAARVWALETMGVRLGGIDMEIREISDTLLSVHSCIGLKINFPLISVAMDGSKIVAVAISAETTSGVSIRTVTADEEQSQSATELVMQAAEQLVSTGSSQSLQLKHFSNEKGKALLTDGSQYFTGYYHQSGSTELAVCVSNNTEDLF